MLNGCDMPLFNVFMRHACSNEAALRRTVIERGRVSNPVYLYPLSFSSSCYILLLLHNYLLLEDRVALWTLRMIADQALQLDVQCMQITAQFFSKSDDRRLISDLELHPFFNPLSTFLATL